MMRRIPLLLLAATLLLVPVLLPAASQYDILEMHSDLDITAEGIYEAQERIVMNFRSPLHGFYRVLPVTYLFDDPQREDVRVRVSAIKASDTFSVFREGSHVTIRVGDANRTVTGRQEYAISYRYDIGADVHEGYDEFYYNIVGEDWEVPIERFSFSITFPKPVSADRISFTKGLWGSKSSDGLVWNLSPDARVISGSSGRLEPGEAITVRVEMPEGYYRERTDWQEILKVPFLLISLFLLVRAWLAWRRYGRDKDLVIVPRFSPPEGMSPLDVGYVIDGSLDPRDVTAMIFYWADKGCLTIVEEGKNFSFIKGRDPVGASKHEKQLFDAFFASGSNGVVKSKDLEGKFFLAYQKLKKTVDRHYRGERALASTRSRDKAALSVLTALIPALGYALILTANHIGPATLALFVVAMVVTTSWLVLFHVMMRTWHLAKAGKKIFWVFVFVFLLVFDTLFLFVAGWVIDVPDADTLFGTLMLLCANVPIALFAIITIQRSEYGRRTLEEVLGLRDFIETVEMDQLKRMIDQDPAYYYHVLSFAIVLGLEKKWAKKFASFTLEPPGWYRGDLSVWNAMVVSSMLGRCNASLISTVGTSPKSSPGSRFGGSSFGGGGFSGGGFGGGGGGAW